MSTDDFKKWWHEVGSGLKPLPGHDHEQHAARIAELAWLDSRITLSKHLIEFIEDRRNQNDRRK